MEATSADAAGKKHYLKIVDSADSVKKSWECGICERDFKHLYMLRRHLASHTDERKYSCYICYKSFRQMATLNQHYSTHSAARPHTCKTCKKSFGRSSTLISHRKIHMTEKSFKCHICSKAFHQKGNLRNHLFCHTGARPYKCKYCKKGFNQQSNLVCHIRKVHAVDSKEAIIKPSPEVIKTATAVTEQTQQISSYDGNELNKNLQANKKSFVVLKTDATNMAVMKILSCQKRHMLLPVTADDLTKHGKLAQYESDSEPFNITYDVPIIAIIKFIKKDNGYFTFQIQSPHDVTISSDEKIE